jgi:hypothetical protein
MSKVVIRSKSGYPHETEVVAVAEDGTEVPIPCGYVEIRLDPNDINKAALYVPTVELDLAILPDGTNVYPYETDGD